MQNKNILTIHEDDIVLKYGMTLPQLSVLSRLCDTVHINVHENENNNLVSEVNLIASSSSAPSGILVNFLFANFSFQFI